MIIEHDKAPSPPHLFFGLYPLNLDSQLHEFPLQFRREFSIICEYVTDSRRIHGDFTLLIAPMKFSWTFPGFAILQIFMSIPSRISHRSPIFALRRYRFIFHVAALRIIWCAFGSFPSVEFWAPAMPTQTWPRRALPKCVSATSGGTGERSPHVSSQGRSSSSSSPYPTAAGIRPGTRHRMPTRLWLGPAQPVTSAN